MAKADCEYCEGTGRVEWDATDSRGEHRSESGPCECVEDGDDWDFSALDELIESASVALAEDRYDTRMTAGPL